MAHIDAQGDLLRGLQVVETACGIPAALLGNNIEGNLSLLGERTRSNACHSEQRHGHLHATSSARCMRKVCVPFELKSAQDH